MVCCTTGGRRERKGLADEAEGEVKVVVVGGSLSASAEPLSEGRQRRDRCKSGTASWAGCPCSWKPSGCETLVAQGKCSCRLKLATGGTQPFELRSAA